MNALETRLWIANMRMRLAVLIDGDNVAAKHADQIFTTVEELGDAHVRRLYGNLADSITKDWLSAVTKYALTSRQQFPLAQMKNAADIALAIDAMDILHAGGVDGFCIISSDCDFTPLAKRIREAGKLVYGFGKACTHESYRASCREFVTLLEPVPSPKAVDPLADVIRQISAALNDCRAASGWAKVSLLGTCLARLDPPVSAKNHQCANLTKLLQKTGQFELKQVGGHFHTRQKPMAAASR
jgi:uncharacterized protein (TIGR00288 family)